MSIPLKMRYITNAAVRVQASQHDRWLVMHLVEHKEYMVSSMIAAMIVLFYQGNSPLEVASFINKIFSIQDKQFNSIIQKLLDSNIILLDSSPPIAKHDDRSEINKQQENIKYIINKWNKFGWFEAADYYVTTFDYPFVDDEDNTYRAKDNSTMLEYYRQELDYNRSKDYDVVSIPLKRPIEYLATLKTPFKDVVSIRTKNRTNLTDEHIKLLTSVTFGTLRTKKGQFPYSKEVIRKTSPSGGSRHPTEGYFLVFRTIDSLNAGIYHFSVAKQALEYIKDFPSVDLRAIFPGVFRGNIELQMIIVLTSFLSAICIGIESHEH